LEDGRVFLATFFLVAAVLFRDCVDAALLAAAFFAVVVAGDVVE
jgi:hypothetical protein